jgi:dihydrofolate synthase / folylpolyglutamate synthase
VTRTGDAVLGVPAAEPGPGESWSVERAEGYLLGLERFGMHFGLEKMRRLMRLLDSPQDRFASIHVVGTNGKSSTTRMIAAILERHGVRTGSYTSPHLVSFAERIQVGERDLPAGRFGPAVERVSRAAGVVDAALTDDGDRVTQFEALTAAAYAELGAAGLDVAVIEAGLGGRYDATSVIDSKVAVLTNIGLEHTAWLGDTIAEIAGEKLAVVPPGGVLVLGAGLHPDAMAVARAVAAEREARIVEAPAVLPPELVLRARGAYQRRNFALATAAAEAYLEAPLDPDAVGRAAGELVVAGRFEVVGEALAGASARRRGAGEAPDREAVTLLDGAHNPPGIEVLVGSLPEFLAGRRLSAVVSILDDKDARSMLAALAPVCAEIVCTQASNPRAVPAGDLAGAARAVIAGSRVGRSPEHVAAAAGPVDGTAVVVEPDPRRALALARRRNPGGVVLVTGSIYLVADIVREPSARPGSIL